MACKFFDKKSSGSVVVTKSATEPNDQLANELQIEVIRKFKRRKVYSSFRDNMWGVDLAHMQSLSKYNKGTNIYCVHLICFINMHELFL